MAELLTPEEKESFLKRHKAAIKAKNLRRDLVRSQIKSQETNTTEINQKNK